jgi:hypothetical protein
MLVIIHLLHYRCGCCSYAGVSADGTASAAAIDGVYSAAVSDAAPSASAAAAAAAQVCEHNLHLQLTLDVNVV